MTLPYRLIISYPIDSAFINLKVHPFFVLLFFSHRITDYDRTWTLEAIIHSIILDLGYLMGK